MERRRRRKDEVTYAELSLPTSVYTNLLSQHNHTTTLPPQRKPILYAQIDFNGEQAMCGHITSETPLIAPPSHHNRESTSKLETILEHNSCNSSNCTPSQTSQPVVTTTRF
ncbi:uncharacterized protein LOC103508644 [Diaphorina citri]|uniref:Uncharacterized protein LOC103508644 n=1 Tax=Diaphorina citri TaxID=121845 RepID=A0A1S3D0B6_DIACI|nr:uncharacterized protein LOC103508644 [Diaphorina citri]